jgi:sodium-coupled monocarboxylate transporter 8/12
MFITFIAFLKSASLGTVAWSMSYALDQQLIQRFTAAKSRRTAQTALLLNIPGVILLISLCCFTGLVLYANFSDCDPLSPEVNQYTGVKNPNQLLPYFVMLKFNTIKFIPGLFLSSIFCASLSSVSSALNSMSACIWRDYLMRFAYFQDANDAKSSVTTKVTALVCGFICTGLGFLISRSDSNLIQISSTINGSLQAPIIGLFLLASLFRFVNVYGLFAGALSGFALGFWLSLGQFLTKPYYPKLSLVTTGCKFNETMPHENLFRNSSTINELTGFNKIYSLSYMWLSPVGVLTTLVVGLVVSVITNFFVEKRFVDDSFLIYKQFKKKPKPDELVDAELEKPKN